MLIDHVRHSVTTMQGAPNRTGTCTCARTCPCTCGTLVTSPASHVTGRCERCSRQSRADAPTQPRTCSPRRMQPSTVRGMMSSARFTMHPIPSLHTQRSTCCFLPHAHSVAPITPTPRIRCTRRPPCSGASTHTQRLSVDASGPDWGTVQQQRLTSQPRLIMAARRRQRKAPQSCLR